MDSQQRANRQSVGSQSKSIEQPIESPDDTALARRFAGTRFGTIREAGTTGSGGRLVVSHGFGVKPL